MRLVQQTCVYHRTKTIGQYNLQELFSFGPGLPPQKMLPRALIIPVIIIQVHMILV
jgi:hypothetical protein